jgi:hypothetical protein
MTSTADRIYAEILAVPKPARCRPDARRAELLAWAEARVERARRRKRLWDELCAALPGEPSIVPLWGYAAAYAAVAQAIDEQVEAEQYLERLQRPVSAG